MTHPFWQNGEFVITTDPAQVDIDVVHRFLSQESYWAKNQPREIVARSIEGSLCFSLHHQPTAAMAGLARVITDRATFAYLTDVFVLPEWRGRGLSKWLLEVITSHPDLQGQRRWLLATGDAHTLYSRFGFAPVARPEIWMERLFIRGSYPLPPSDKAAG